MAQYNALAERYKEDQKKLNYRAAMICSILAEIYRDRKKRPKAFTPNDFMPQEKKGPMDTQQMSSAIKDITLTLGGEEK